ncbi:MAG: hypothetical protein LAO77_23125 [Acidobacteriia bacterium]|nr:hypothetical protein [Terriglobia bacterium]
MLKSFLGAGAALVVLHYADRDGVAAAVLATLCFVVGFGLFDSVGALARRVRGRVPRGKAAA